jgi:hypothetical protein
VPSLSKPDHELTLSLGTLRDVPIMVPVLFALAAFLAGYAASEYSARVAGLFAQRGEGIYCVQNCQGAYESWYRHNQEATKSVSPARRIALFGFPTAMTLATILAMSLGLLPGVRVPRLFPGIGLLFGGIVATSALGMLSFVFSMSKIFLPLGLTFGLLAVAVYPYSLVLARAVLTGRDASPRGESGRVFLALFLAIPLGVIVGVMLHWFFPPFTLIYGIQVVLGALFGASLALPRVSPQLLPVPVRILPTERRTIERLVLALGALIAVSAITLFQRASRPLVPLDSTQGLLAPFILTQLPFVILICVLLKQPGRRAFTFLIAMLASSIVVTFFEPMVILSYRQIYADHRIGLIWPFFSGSIYAATSVLAYRVIEKTRLRPKPSHALLGTIGMFSYFLVIQQITPNFQSFWR